MKKIIVLGTCVFMLGMLTALFRHKIIAGDAALVISEDKVLVNITNDSAYPVRVYLNQDAQDTILVNQGRTFVQQMRSGDMVNVYTPEHNTTFHVTLNAAGRTELLGKEIRVTVQELRDIASERTASWTGYESERGSTQYFDIEEEAVSPYGSAPISY